MQYLNEIGEQDRRIAAQVRVREAPGRRPRARRRRSCARPSRARRRSSRRAPPRPATCSDELVGARERSRRRTKQQKLTDLSKLTASEQAEAGEIDALQAAIERHRRAARSAPHRSGTTATPSSAGLIWPVSGPITSPFGWRWGRMHQGIDIGVPYGHADPGGRRRHGHLLRLGVGLRQPDGDRPRRQPRHRVRPPELDRRHLRRAGRPGTGDRLRRLHRPLHRPAPALRGAVDGNPVDPLGYL